MYFSKLPNIEYSKKPIRFPISDTEYVLAKNLFRKYKIKEKAFQSSVFFNKYTIEDGERLDTISAKVYGSAEYDWVIMITNNIINPYYHLPVRDSDLYSFVSSNYDDPEGIHHYETLEVKNSSGLVVQKEGLKVDLQFVSRQHKFYDNGSIIVKNGTEITKVIRNYDYEKTLNDERREIFLLRPELLEKFVSDFENINEYSRSSEYINKNTKKTGI